MNNKEVIQKALQIVNEVREICGLAPLDDLPKGFRKRQLSCPIANALPDDPSVGWDMIKFADKDSADALAKVLKSSVHLYPGRKRRYAVVTEGSAIASFPKQFDERGGPEFERYAL